MSAGTGTLVRPDLIVTNNHVVQDRAGKIRVLFPDWSVYIATVVKTDKLWDLAALKIKPVLIPPIELGKYPKKNEILTVGGYGSGWYETSKGKVVGYYKPDSRSPSDIVMVDAKVRNGDSGGPILKDGKLVGVLFGSSDGTYGVNIERVRKFLKGIK